MERSMNPRDPLDERVSDWLEGRLSPDEARALEEALAREGRLEEARELARVVHLLGKAPLESPPPGLPDRVVERITGASPAPAPALSRGRKALPWVLSLSAAAAAALLVYITLPGGGSPPPKGSSVRVARVEGEAAPGPAGGAEKEKEKEKEEKGSGALPPPARVLKKEPLNLAAKEPRASGGGKAKAQSEVSRDFKKEQAGKAAKKGLGGPPASLDADRVLRRGTAGRPAPKKSDKSNKKRAPLSRARGKPAAPAENTAREEGRSKDLLRGGEAKKITGGKRLAYQARRRGALPKPKAPVIPTPPPPSSPPAPAARALNLLGSKKGYRGKARNKQGAGTTGRAARGAAPVPLRHLLVLSGRTMADFGLEDFRKKGGKVAVRPYVLPSRKQGRAARPGAKTFLLTLSGPKALVEEAVKKAAARAGRVSSLALPLPPPPPGGKGALSVEILVILEGKDR